MAKKDDERLVWRMQGMSYAYDIMRKYENKEEGFKALEAEMKVRKHWAIPMEKVPTGYIEALAKQMRSSINDGVMRWLVTTIRAILKDKYGYGQLRQDRFIAYLEYQCECIRDKYVTVEDLAEMLEEGK